PYLRTRDCGAPAQRATSTRAKARTGIMTPMQRLTSLSIVALLAASPVAQGFSPSLGALASTKAVQLSALRVGARTVPRPGVGLRMQVADEEKEKKKDVEEVTKKYGLEAGLFTALT
ncbi:MAG: hypothetical protein ACPIOQ_43565, partial [Promethearchaeia archaeon]